MLLSPDLLPHLLPERVALPPAAGLAAVHRARLQPDRAGLPRGPALGHAGRGARTGLRGESTRI